MNDRGLRDRVREARKAMGLSQAKFAKLAGVGERMYQNFEGGANRPQPANLRKILDAAGIDPGDAGDDADSDAIVHAIEMSGLPLWRRHAVLAEYLRHRHEHGLERTDYRQETP